MTAEPSRVAVIGVGHMGRHHARIYSEMANTDLVAVVDADADRAAEFAQKFGGVALSDVADLPDSVQAASVAVPTVHHVEVASALLNRGIARWEAANGLSASEADELRAKLSERQAQTAIHHMGAHLVLSVAIAIPIPGVRSLARFLWTFAFLVKAQAGRLLRRVGARDATSVHTPLVMVLALLPVVGGIAYLAARPLRSKLLIRVALDEVALEMPFSLYRRLRVGRWLAPKGQISVGEFG